MTSHPHPIQAMTRLSSRARFGVPFLFLAFLIGCLSFGSSRVCAADAAASSPSGGTFPQAPGPLTAIIVLDDVPTTKLEEAWLNKPIHTLEENMAFMNAFQLGLAISRDIDERYTTSLSEGHSALERFGISEAQLERLAELELLKWQRQQATTAAANGHAFVEMEHYSDSESEMLSQVTSMTEAEIEAELDLEVEWPAYVNKAMSKAKTMAKSAVSKAKSVTKRVVNKAKAVSKKVVNKAKAVTKKVVNKAKSVAKKAKSVAKKVVNKAKKVVKKAKAVAKKVVNKAKKVVNKAKSVAKKAVNKAKSVAKKVANKARSAVKKVTTGAKKLANKAKAGLKKATNKIKAGAKKLVNKAKAGVGKLKAGAKKLMNKAKAGVGKLKAGAKNLVNKAKNGAKGLMNKAKAGMNKMKAGAKNLVNKAKAGVGKLKAGAKNLMSKAKAGVGKLKSGAKNLMSKAKSGLGKLKSGAKGLLSKAKSGLAKAGAGLKKLGTNMKKGMKNMKEGMKKVGAGLKKVGQAVNKGIQYANKAVNAVGKGLDFVEQSVGKGLKYVTKVTGTQFLDGAIDAGLNAAFRMGPLGTFRAVQAGVNTVAAVSQGLTDSGLKGAWDAGKGAVIGAAKDYVMSKIPGGAIMEKAMSGPLGNMVKTMGKGVLNSPAAKKLIATAQKGLASKMMQTPMAKSLVKKLESKAGDLIATGKEKALGYVNDKIQEKTGINLNLDKIGGGGKMDFSKKGLLKSAKGMAKEIATDAGTRFAEEMREKGQETLNAQAIARGEEPTETSLDSLQGVGSGLKGLAGSMRSGASSLKSNLKSGGVMGTMKSLGKAGLAQVKSGAIAGVQEFARAGREELEASGVLQPGGSVTDMVKSALTEKVTSTFLGGGQATEEEYTEE